MVSIMLMELLIINSILNMGDIMINLKYILYLKIELLMNVLLQ